MRIGKLFHLTMLVDDLAGPEAFFNSVFSPLCSMRGYSAHWHRHAAIYTIAETAIEPMHVLPPEPGHDATSWFRYLDRFGPRIHNMAFYADDLGELEQRFIRAGIRVTDGGAPGTLFAHPKDTPGMVEFHTPGPDAFLAMDPRFSDSWSAFSDDYWPHRHPLGLERLSHITVLVNDVAAACDFYASLLDATELSHRRSHHTEVESRFVLVGEDTVLELAQPLDRAGDLGQELTRVGQGPVGVTFKVRDLSQATAHLERHEAPIGSVDGAVLLDRAQTWGVEFRFTDEGLDGDPRAS